MSLKLVSFTCRALFVTQINDINYIILCTAVNVMSLCCLIDCQIKYNKDVKNNPKGLFLLLFDCH